MKLRTYTAGLDSTENPPMTKKFVKETEYLKQKLEEKRTFLRISSWICLVENVRNQTLSA